MDVCPDFCEEAVIRKTVDMALSSLRIAYVAITRKIKMGYDNAEVINP